MTHPVPVIRGRYRRPKQPGRPPKSGARALAKHIACNSLDGRTWIAKALKDIRDDLAADRGGWERCGAAERILIDRAASLSVIVQSIEHWVFTQGGVVTPDGELLGVLRKGYATHTANLGRILTALGLRPDRARTRCRVSPSTWPPKPRPPPPPCRRRWTPRLPTRCRQQRSRRRDRAPAPDRAGRRRGAGRCGHRATGRGHGHRHRERRVRD